MTKQKNPPAPVKDSPSMDWEHYQLYKDVREAIASLPIYFRTETHISGIMATDLHTLNNDRDFDPIETYCGLKVVRVSKKPTRPSRRRPEGRA